MQAAIRNMTDGSVALKLDADAARAVFASVLFASRFHEDFSPLARLAKEALERKPQKPLRRGDSCR
jgi:hypothetical protein